MSRSHTLLTRDGSFIAIFQSKQLLIILFTIYLLNKNSLFIFIWDFLINIKRTYHVKSLKRKADLTEDVLEIRQKI